MHRAFVPPSREMTQEPADTRPPSIWKKVRVAAFGAGTIRDKVGFPYVMWGRGNGEAGVRDVYRCLTFSQ